MHISPDNGTVKVLCISLLMSLAAAGQSHPSWWSYSSPDATALVGIRWDNLRDSPFAAAIQVELSSAGPLAFPDLASLRQAKQIVISSPELLAAATGNFTSSVVREQAQKAGLRRAVYRGVTLWVPEKAAALGVAQISEQIILVGARKTLLAAIDQSMLEKDRQYSALLPRAARFSQTGDLWVVAVSLPDPLASLFVPLDVNATDFSGQVSMKGGLAVEAQFQAASSSEAASVAAALHARSSSFPPIARGLETTSEQNTVLIQLEASEEELRAALHPEAARAPVATATAMAPVQIASAPGPTPPAPATSIAPSIVAAPMPAPEPKHTEPQVIRIIGLEGGTREIIVKPQ